jgi:hypothetical protein
MSEQSPSEPEEEPGRSLAPLVVSAAALVLAAVHVAFPDVTVDGATLILLAVAALPWLAPILKSVTLPGGFEVVLRDIQEKVVSVQAQVDESSRRVDDLASSVRELLFEGEPVAAERRTEISTVVANFRAFLADRGMPVPPSDPRVKIMADVRVPYYVGGEPPEIVIGPATSSGDTLRAYAHHVIGALYKDRAFSSPRHGVQYGLVGYFTCSHEGVAPFAEPMPDDVLTEALTTPMQSNEEVFHVGEAWAQLFWGLRDDAGAEVADRLLASAWVGSAGRRGDFAKVFTRRLVEEARASAGPQPAEAIEDRLRAAGFGN